MNSQSSWIAFHKAGYRNIMNTGNTSLYKTMSKSHLYNVSNDMLDSGCIGAELWVCLLICLSSEHPSTTTREAWFGRMSQSQMCQQCVHVSVLFLTVGTPEGMGILYGPSTWLGIHIMVWVGLYRWSWGVKSFSGTGRGLVKGRGAGAGWR